MTPTNPAKTKAFNSVKLAAWPEADRRLMQEARKPKTFLRPGGMASEWRKTTFDISFSKGWRESKRDPRGSRDGGNRW